MMLTAPTPAGYERSPLGLLTPIRRRREYGLPVGIDFFAGAGGFSMGFHQAGIHVAAAVEMWAPAAMTYLANLARPGVQIHFDTNERRLEFSQDAAEQMGVLIDRTTGEVLGPDPKAKGADLNRHGMRVGGAGSGWISGQPRSHPGCEHFWFADIRNLTGAEILDALDIEQGDVAVVFGGPPCQGFSIAGKRNIMDPRNSLMFEFARLICEIMPRTFVMENVPAIESMVTAEGMPVLDAFALALGDGGYGEYEALRRAMVATGKTAVKRGGGKKAAKTKRAPKKSARPVQRDLLDELEASA